MSKTFLAKIVRMLFPVFFPCVISEIQDNANGIATRKTKMKVTKEVKKAKTKTKIRPCHRRTKDLQQT